MGAPAHASASQLVVFLLDARRHALALPSVERVLPMVAVAPLPEAPPVASGVINVGGTIVPVFDLRVRFALPRPGYGLSAQLLLVRTPRRQVALATDRVLGVIDVGADSMTSVDTTVPGTRGLAGIVALADGLVFIHDLDALLSLDEEQRLDRAIEAAAG